MPIHQQLSPGTVVKFKGNPLGQRNPFAIVVRHDRGSDTVRLQTEGSDDTLVTRHEISAVRNPPPTPLRRLRHRMPYGKWTCADGREVLFNRNYKPIWQRRPGQYAEAADADEWVPFERQEHYYTDRDQPWRSIESEQRCNQVLASWDLPTV